MASVRVDQLGSDAQLVEDFDVRLSTRERTNILLDSLPGAYEVKFAGVNAIRFAEHLILSKQVTYLGTPWPIFKKRIQIPRTWVEAEREGRSQGLIVRFVGVYHYAGTTIFVDFDPTRYVLARANNSAAHVATNDLYQALTLGEFSRSDRNGNRITSVAAQKFADYLRFGQVSEAPWIDVFREFNSEFLDGPEISALESIREMYAADWPDAFQAEWPGFYAEFRLDEFLRRRKLASLVTFQKVKSSGAYDFDLILKNHGTLHHYGDLKASDITKKDAPGNDSQDLLRCIKEFGRFWYVIYEHSTKHSRDYGDVETIQWNTWKHSVGYDNGKPYNPLSYARRFKAAVRFERMMILEVNQANVAQVFRDFNQGRQPDGKPRALKVLINKRNIDNYLIYTSTAP